jgi:putative nucleotidyltransferase with HDIG domain
MARRQLLIIHTDRTACKRLASPLIRSGSFSVEYACNAFDGAVKLFTNDYDCLIIHVDTPGLDAINAIQRIRESELTACLPIFVLYNNQDSLTIRALKAVGANAFQAEPVSIQKLISTVMVLTKLVEPGTASEPFGAARVIRGNTPQPVPDLYKDGPNTQSETETEPVDQPQTPTEATPITPITVNPVSSTNKDKSEGKPLIDRIWFQIKNAEPVPGIPAEITRMDNIIGDLSGERLSKEVVGLDLNLAIGILRQVNSIDYRGLETISGLTRAMNRIGIREINHRFNVTYQTRKTLPKHTCDFILGGFARHSLMVACLSEEIAGAQRGFDGDTAFSAGLLHDVGKLFLVHNFPESYQLVQDADVGLWDEDGKFSDIAAIERELLQIDHGIAGYELTRAWLLPQAVQVGTVHHEENSSVRNSIRESRYAIVVALADLMDQVMERQAYYGIDDLDLFFRSPDRDLPPWLTRFTKGLRTSLRHLYDRARRRTNNTLDHVQMGRAA